MSIASSTSTAAPSGSSISLSIGMVFSRASQPTWEANPELRDHQSFAVTTISSIARAVGSHLGKRRNETGKVDHWQVHKQSVRRPRCYVDTPLWESLRLALSKTSSPDAPHLIPCLQCLR